MEELSLRILDLRSPLVYTQTQTSPPDNHENYTGQEELLFCYELDPAQSSAIKPERGRLLAALAFIGCGAKNGNGGKTVSLPAGTYLFAQRRQALGKNEWLDIAVEQQKECLKNKLRKQYEPQPSLYVRYLFEDGSPVTQLFRPAKNL